MTFKQYDSLKEGTKVELRINGKVVTGTTKKRWEETKRGGYWSTRFLPDGGTRSQDNHPTFIYLSE